MKLSLAWIFDHIKSHTYTEFDLQELLQSLSGMPAEIEHFHEVIIKWDDFSLVNVQEISAQVLLESAEWRKKITLPIRLDTLSIGQYFLIKKEGSIYRWATLADLGSEKDGLVPELLCSEADSTGAWKKTCESRDYILNIDNKSITNRPDLWSHRGLAREITVLLGFEMIPEENLLKPVPIQHYATKTDSSASYAIALETDVCTRFAGIEIDCNKIAPSLPWMVARLARVDARSRNLLVDATNYVMFDIGQPMHAFDAEKIDSKTLIIRPALSGEKLTVIDDTTLELTPHDTVIADTRYALSLAGIIGGSESAIKKDTTKIFLESAHFDGTALRLSAARYKKRTESSIRFEKVLDPHANTTALLRYLKLLDDTQFDYTLNTPIISIGTLAPERIIIIDYRFIIERLGISILPTRIEDTFKRLGFGIQSSEGPRGITYTLTVPTWRAGKDLSIKEDILEEIGRCFGYTNIHPISPSRVMIPQDYSHVYLRRAIKQECAFSLSMREVCNYSLYDEQFLNKIKLVIPTSFAIKNPVSENVCRMVTSLIPHLLKNIYQNCANEETLRFFEWARIWSQDESLSITDEMHGICERTTCSGIMYSERGIIDFYEEKAELQKLFKMKAILVEWRPINILKDELIWMNPFQTAELVCQEKIIGYAGMITRELVVAVNPVAGENGSAFCFELYVDIISKLQPIEYHFSEPSKYQPVDLDISMIVPFDISIARLEEILVNVDARIKDVILIDVFEQPTWKNQRSVTMRCRLQDDEKTMTKDDIEELQTTLHAAVKQYGAQVR